MDQHSRGCERAAGDSASIICLDCRHVSIHVREFIGAAFPYRLMLHLGDQLADMNARVVCQCDLLRVLPRKFRWSSVVWCGLRWDASGGRLGGGSNKEKFHRWTIR